MLDIKIYEQYLEIEEKIEDEAQKLLSEIHAIRPIEDFKHLYFSKLADSCIEYFGEESWSYGGHASYEDSLPSQLLFDKEYKEQYINDLKEKVAKSNKEKAERDEKIRLANIEKDKAQYEALKVKFEGDTK
jgi:hypothetical protein